MAIGHPACSRWRMPVAIRRIGAPPAPRFPYLPSIDSRGKPMLQAQGLWKSYGDKAAVRGVSLEVGAGEILGLLGPNGAGKSTTVAMLCGLTPPDRGTITIAGSPAGDGASPAKQPIG